MVHEVLRWLQVEGELPEFVVVVKAVPRLQVGDVKGVADTLEKNYPYQTYLSFFLDLLIPHLYVRSQQQVGGPKEGEYPVLHLSAHLLGGPERVLRGNVLNVVGDGVVGQQGGVAVDVVHGVLEGQLRGAVLLIVCAFKLKLIVGGYLIFCW